MKTKLNFVSSLARNVRQFSVVSVKSVLRPANPYQQFDHRNSSLQKPSLYMKISQYFHSRPNMHRKFSQLKITPTVPCWHCDHRLISIANGINSIFCDKCGVLRNVNKDDVSIHRIAHHDAYILWLFFKFIGIFYIKFPNFRILCICRKPAYRKYDFFFRITLLLWACLNNFYWIQANLQLNFVNCKVWYIQINLATSMCL